MTPPPTDSLDEQWRILQRQLDFASGPWLGFLFVRSSAALLWLRCQTKAYLRERSPVWIDHANEPTGVPELLGDVLRNPTAQLVWLDLLHQDPAGPWAAARRQLLLRANERREALLRAARGGLLLALPLAEKSTVRDAAPDLWSMRSLVLDLVDRDAWKRQPETFRLPQLAPSMLPLQRSWMLRRLFQIGIHELVDDGVGGAAPLDHSVEVSYPLECVVSSSFNPRGEDTDGAVLAERGDYQGSLRTFLHQERHATDPSARWRARVERSVLEAELAPTPEPLQIPWPPGGYLPLIERRMEIAQRILATQKSLLDGDLLGYVAYAFEVERQISFEWAFESVVLAAAPLAGNEQGIDRLLPFGYLLKISGLSDIHEDLSHWFTCRLESLELAHHALGHLGASSFDSLRGLVLSAPTLPPHRRRVVEAYTVALQDALVVAEAGGLDAIAGRLRGSMQALGLGPR